MNKVLPFVFPLAALAIVIFLAFRWYGMRTSQGQIGPVNEGVQIENLTQEQRESVLRGTQDMKTVVLQPTDESDTVSGDVRYDLENGKVLFSVSADLPALAEGQYQVWVKSGSKVSPAFILEMNKGGYMGSAAISESELPVEVSISKEMSNDQTMEDVLLHGTINK